VREAYGQNEEAGGYFFPKKERSRREARGAKLRALSAVYRLEWAIFAQIYSNIPDYPLVRVRFAPSPTGPLHIGGVRTALFNYLFAKKHGGKFILRIEDTDQNRFVPGAENYILESLKWLGLQLDESVEIGGPYGPYRQSDRRETYLEYARLLLERGGGYYAFDTEEELKALRDEYERRGDTFKYDYQTRKTLRNSLSLAPEEVEALLAAGHPYVVRLLVPGDRTLTFRDAVRGEVSYETKDLDDKVMLKADGMPTYHLANVVDDRLMAITHVIRGEEWLPSTPTHVLLYEFFGWRDEMPTFAHLPLLLKPTGKGKLSKRDGLDGGFPVFPLDWTDPASGETVSGFRGKGFLPEATLNFLALLGWNPGTEQEIFTLEELVQAFTLEQVSSHGARFDIKKAEWFNQQYLIRMSEEQLVPLVGKVLADHGHAPDADFLRTYTALFRERVTHLGDFFTAGYYLLEPLRGYDEAEWQKKVLKKWSAERAVLFAELGTRLENLTDFTAENVQTSVETFVSDKGLGFGDVLPALRLAVSGTLQGPPVFEIMALLGQFQSVSRWAAFIGCCVQRHAAG
jgi:glutamyl-tRNA synthetase